jgi:hypothetical protein
MERIILTRRLGIALFLVFLLGIVWTGCSTTVKERREETGKPAEGQEIKAPPSKYYARYYHFDDVLVPGELKYKQNKSFIYETPQFKAGSLYLTKWWLDVDSLIDFFTYHMEKDNWKAVNSYRGKESFLSFSKPDRTCNIRITERWYGMTHVEIRVGPLVVKKM